MRTIYKSIKTNLLTELLSKKNSLKAPKVKKNSLVLQVTIQINSISPQK